MNPDGGDDVAECRECDAQWLGAEAWEGAWTHAHETKHRTLIVGRV